MSYDLIIRGGTVVREQETAPADIAIIGQSIVDIAPDLPGNTRQEIDARGLHVFPGAIDPHVHFNEPGRTDWEGFATGSSAAAGGGVSCVFDMPLNSSPPTLDGPSFDAKRQAAEASSYVDFALWGGLTPGNLDKLEELANRGVVGLKAFLCDSGIDDFPRADDWTLFRGMMIARQLGLIVAVHAENHEITAGLRQFARQQNFTTVRHYLRSRPQITEIEAIGRAIALAGETCCPLHIVHVSTVRGIELVAEARAKGVDVTCETCPHYLTFTADDAERLGAIGKCAPPLRSPGDRDGLWEHLAGGRIDFVASDHSPAPPSLKSAPDFFDCWGGIAGIQTLLPTLLSRSEVIAPRKLARLTASNAARRFRLPRKGRIEAGCDADLTLVDLQESYELTRDRLLDRHRLSPFVGIRFRGRIRRTLVRGQTVFVDGRIVGPPRGTLVRPET
ncbi:MAG: allantoinase AllB [Phycisphaerae bacterium]|nr:allantoinase AllB [Phycisphaerae bacterium]MDW8263000.1 allantoinase AllB [Phycisphaerales bacterium]